jgi:uncharacterized protein YfbU (UPF0304 family)
VQGVYTKQIETCDSKDWMDMKVNRMLVHWCNILCQYIDISKLPCDNILDHNTLLFDLIQVEIKRLNEKNKANEHDRTFRIHVYDEDKLVQWFD